MTWLSRGDCRGSWRVGQILDDGNLGNEKSQFTHSQHELTHGVVYGRENYYLTGGVYLLSKSV